MTKSSDDTWLISYKKRPESDISAPNNFTKFDSYSYSWITSDGSKKKKPMYMIQEAGVYMEFVIEQVFTFEDDICSSAGWTGKERFEQFPWMLSGTARKAWKKLMKDGSDGWNKKDKKTNGDFRTAVKEWLAILTKERAPGQMQKNHLLSIKWAKTFEKGSYVDPVDYWERMEDIWDMLKVFGISMPDNTTLLRGEYYAFPTELQTYFQDDVDGTGTDVFDTANGGVQEWNLQELFEAARKWWKKNNNRTPEGSANINDNNSNINSNHSSGSDNEKGGTSHHGVAW